MNFFNLQEIDHHHHHHHHHNHRNRTDEHDHIDSGGSTGSRSYDCVFCQRGFTTAQALGGHMNIHRKDRVANPNKPNDYSSPTKDPKKSILSNKEMLLEEDNYDNHQIEATNTRLFYSSKSFLSSHNQHHHSNNDGSSSFEGRLHRFLGSEKWGGDHMLGKKIQDHEHSKEGEELDLELRLGHYSW